MLQSSLVPHSSPSKHDPFLYRLIKVQIADVDFLDFLLNRIEKKKHLEVKTKYLCKVSILKSNVQITLK